MTYRLIAIALIAVLPIAGLNAQAPPSPTPPIPASAQGKIVVIQGHVDSAVSTAQDQWNPARLFQPLYVSDRIRTLTASRSAILFIDETQVKLNAGAVLTVQQIKTAGGTSTTLNLLEGEGWFRTKNPASGLTVKTPRAAAAIRGTEINLVVRGNDAVLTVTEGAVEFSNDAGLVVVNAGEEATATPGQLPTKRTLLNPEDAVQWVLYYPARVTWHDLPAAAQAGPARTGFDRLIAGDPAGAVTAFQPTVATDPWSRIGTAMALRTLGDPTAARTTLSEALTGDVDVERRVEMAASSLAVGDAVGARVELTSVLQGAPASLRALVMLSQLELTQNHAPEAEALARRAIAAHPESVAAHIAAGEAAQATFDLDAAYRDFNAALAIDPMDIRALVDRGRVRFGTGDTVGARQDVDAALARAPIDAQLRSLLGFIKLAAGDDAGARVDFDAAAASDAALGEPHLGLGLLDFRAALYDDGLLEMLTATLLEPKVSLYQSYLGKAYYQLQRFPEGLAALASAKRLDPRDPTPWLYASFFLRDQNRQVDALEQLRHAISLNDNRAVYRSRLLLDRDLATKNVSLAQLYNQLGFEAWGAYEALNSLNADLTNASAHLFMSETYGNLPDRTQASGGEINQYFLYSPVNLNSFNNFSEYTALLERPFKQLSVTQDVGNLSRLATNVRTQSGNQRLAHTAFINYSHQDGSRVDASDYRVQGSGVVKLSLGDMSDVFATASFVKQEQGKDTDDIRSIGTFPLSVNVDVIVPNPDPTFTRRKDLSEGAVGFTHRWTPGSVVTMKADALNFDGTDEDPDSALAGCPSEVGISDLSPLSAHSSTRISLPFHGVSLQAQQSTRVSRHQLLVGGDYTKRHKTFRCHDFITSSVLTGSITADLEHNAIERATGGYVRDDIELTRWLHVTAGARYVSGLYQDPQGYTPDYKFDRWNPYVGASIRVRPSTVVHAAAFRNTNVDFLSSNIWPPTIAGFVFDRNELPTAQRDEADVAVQSAWSRSFLEVRALARSTVAPAFRVLPTDPDPVRALFATSLTPPDADFKGRGLSVFFNQIVTSRLSLFADDQFATRDAPIVDRRDNQLRAGLNYILPSGLFARVSTRWLRQRFLNTEVAGLPDSSFALTDAEVKYEFARKHGLLTFTVTNLFDSSFKAVIENLSVDSPKPFRTAIVSLRWRL